ncbi:MAG TPA: heme lyase CcmF/NrfE family subunit [Gemmatimonadaceae bacterium]|nr:heme lyase CcmF/NrfE family subunit [Gemmatimonadaceae bacterium]
MILIGELSLWVALLMAAWAMTVSFAGGALRRADLVASGRRAIYATFVMIVLASAGLWTALLSRDFSLEYVAGHISANMPNVYVFTAFWSGQAGSMLFWALILSFYSTIAVFANRRTNRELVPYAAGTLGAILLFFLATTCFKANPYARLDFIPVDGRGMNPQLQNPGMAIHPPNLYLGYVATAIPFAFAVAALVTRRLDAEWLRVVRRWALLSWFFLTIGIILGMWWAYVELGWGGYWAWDPVENASFLPWLTGTAFLHSIMVQEKRGMLRKWNVVLVVITFLLSIFGTFITRSGVIESVHSFAQSPVGSWFASFFFLATGATIYLVATRLNDLHARVELESMVSREAAFLYNNLLLVGIAFTVLWGTLFPILSEWVRGEKITVGPPFFNAVNRPLGLLLLALTGVGPLIAWRRASTANLRRQFIVPVLCGISIGVVLLAAGMREVYALVAYILGGFVAATILQEFWKGIGARRAIHGENAALAFVHLVARNRRRYGGYIVHAGIVLVFAAFAGLAFKTEHDISLRAGQAFETTDPYGRHWRFVSQGVSTEKRLNRLSTGVALEATRDGKPVGIITSEKRQYFDSAERPTFEPVTEVGIHYTARMDTYVVLAGVRGDVAEMRITFNPLVVWVWTGGYLMMIGGLVVMWPQAERRRRVQGGYVSVLPPAAAEPREEAAVGA